MITKTKKQEKQTQKPFFLTIIVSSPPSSFLDSLGSPCFSLHFHPFILINKLLSWFVHSIPLCFSLYLIIYSVLVLDFFICKGFVASLVWLFQFKYATNPLHACIFAFLWVISMIWVVQNLRTLGFVFCWSFLFHMYVDFFSHLLWIRWVWPILSLIPWILGDALPIAMKDSSHFSVLFHGPFELCELCMIWGVY